MPVKSPFLIFLEISIINAIIQPERLKRTLILSFLVLKKLFVYLFSFIFSDIFNIFL